MKVCLYAQNGGAQDGMDMNLIPAWSHGFTGQGVVVSILDDGIQTDHPDLAANYGTSTGWSLGNVTDIEVWNSQDPDMVIYV
uniref:Peptidase S8/S53 domain-containing protein n=1 Tax=Timema douglasi TaxID=61478 RepID=A0A7R8Z605_TIMDO|nr:unnamed protein product [Timema douglasi]